MFYGEYEHTIDRKGRLIVPAKFREALKTLDNSTLFLTRGLDRCLFLFSESEWRVTENRFKQIPFTKGEGRKFNRMFFSGAVDVLPDKQGRFIIPAYLKDYANIKRDTIIIGVANRLEIWD